MSLTPALESSPLFYKSWVSLCTEKQGLDPSCRHHPRRAQLTILKKICTLKASSSKRSETGLLINKGCKRALGAFAPTEVSFTWKPATGLKVAHGGRTGGRENSPPNPQLPTALPPQRGLKKWTKRKPFSMLLSRFKGLVRLLVFVALKMPVAVLCIRLAALSLGCGVGCALAVMWAPRLGALEVHLRAL